jgi:DNA polymerase/3'-5' exonuclease PolX
MDTDTATTATTTTPTTTGTTIVLNENHITTPLTNTHNNITTTCIHPNQPIPEPISHKIVTSRDDPSWMGPWYIQPGDIIQFCVVPEHVVTTPSTTVSSSTTSSVEPLQFQLCRHRRHCCISKLPPPPPPEEKKEGTESPTVNHGNLHNNGIHQKYCSNNEIMVTNDTIRTDCNSAKTNPIIINATTSSNNLPNNNIRPVSSSSSSSSSLSLLPHLRPLKMDDSHHDTVATVKPRKTSSSFTSSFVLYFVPKGTDMHPTIHIPILQQNAMKRGATVLSTFHYSNIRRESTKKISNNATASSGKSTMPDMATTILHPTHFILSTKVSHLDTIAEVLGFRDVEEMSYYVQEHNITCVTRDWAAESDINDPHHPYTPPNVLQIVPGFRTTMNRHSYPSKQRKLRHKVETYPPTLTMDKIRDQNRPLSDLFRQLAKLHQDCPLFPNDDWKAYMFQLVSGRIMHLDFVVTMSELDRLSRMKGFGASTIQILHDFFETGVCRRIMELEQDPQRKAMRTMMQIWGVGRARATELVTAGYRRIGDVRQAIQNGTLHLDRNQYIGLLCYDDINERMPRTEVEAIAKIITTFVHNRYTTSAETMIMGSYRRGKETCGDVDVLITHPDYMDTVPSHALGEIVDDLCTTGHVAFHLTYISGMKPELYETLPNHVAQQLTHPKSYGRSKEKKDKYTMSSWMGVMNSPLIPGKRRRVDIKFYPYSERFLASLYFTGNGHFNRSMRLYAKRKYNYMLSDHGLIDKNTERPIIYHPTSERDIFDVLGLQWKETNERECFDDVEPYDETATDGVISAQKRSPCPEFTRDEVIRDSAEHVWID